VNGGTGEGIREDKVCVADIFRRKSFCDFWILLCGIKLCAADSRGLRWFHSEGCEWILDICVRNIVVCIFIYGVKYLLPDACIWNAKTWLPMMISEHNPSKTSSSASQSIIQRKSSSFCSSPYTIFQSEKEKGTMKFLKIRRVPIIIDRVQEAIVRNSSTEKQTNNSLLSFI